VDAVVQKGKADISKHDPIVCILVAEKEMIPYFFR